MRYLFRLLCVCALGVVPMVGCLDWDWGDPCEGVACPPDDNECTVEYCSDGSCRSDPLYGVSCTYDGLSGVCFKGVCREPVGDCTADDFARIDSNKIPSYEDRYWPPAEGDEPDFSVFLDCLDAWADAFDGAEPECPDSVTSCYFENPETTLTRECTGCWALGQCCFNACEDPDSFPDSLEECFKPCIDEQHDCMFGVQPSDGGGGGRCSAAQQGDARLGWLFAALALIAIRRTSRRGANSA